MLETNCLDTIVSNVYSKNNVAEKVDNRYINNCRDM